MERHCTPFLTSNLETCFPFNRDSGQVEVVLRVAAAQYAIQEVQQSVVTLVESGSVGGVAVVNTSATIQENRKLTIFATSHAFL